MESYRDCIASLGSMDILNNIISSGPWTQDIFLFVCVSSTSFLSVLWFSLYRFFTSSFKFIPKYFVIFDVIVHGIVFFFRYFTVSENKCNWFLYTWNFTMRALGVSVYKIMSSVNRQFYFFFIWMAIFLFIVWLLCLGLSVLFE